ncbi:MAG: dienelactone hydrolase family protein [Alphaproteobacteria bacterium]|nr:dienelactone hydrolase family protein [Alphaproteobacteria bacterium]
MPDLIITGPDGRFPGYLAVPETGAGPGIVLIQEIFGVNKVMRDLADGFAGNGYAVLCPDLFWRQEEGIQLTDQTEEHWARAFELYQGFDEDAGIVDLTAALDHLRGHEACTGKVGTVGYCLGGKLAYLMATRSDADCNVGYYGVGIENNLDEAGNIGHPLMLHVAEKDQFCPAEAQQKIHAALDGAANVTIRDYGGMDHAFARVGGEHYDADAAAAANGRTSTFFEQHLRG